MSPSMHNYILCGTSAGLYESRDGGATWRPGGGGQINVDVSALAFLDRRGQTIIAADNTFGGAYLSRDGGSHWQKVQQDGFGARVRSIAQDPSNRSLLYLGTASDGVYRLWLPELEP